MYAVEAEDASAGTFLHLTANESWASETARRIGGLRVGDRYVVGPGDDLGVEDFAGFTFSGYPAASSLLASATRAAKDMLGAAEVSLAPLSGVHAMTCALLSLTEPGDHVVCVHPGTGGHFATAGILRRSGRHPVFVRYQHESLSIDASQLAEAVCSSGARCVYLDVSSTIRSHDLASIRSAVGPDTRLIYDASHVLGLIMGGRFQHPLSEGADVISANTHKTLPGPQKGLLAFRDQDLADRANDVIDNALISSTHSGSTLALAVTLLEMEEFGSEYAEQVIANSNALGASLSELGLDVRTTPDGAFSENHQVHLFCDRFGTPSEVASRLHRARISGNVDTAIGPRAYLRIGTQELTRRGMAEPEMSTIAAMLNFALRPAGGDLGHDVSAFVAQHTGSAFSFSASNLPARLRSNARRPESG
ncbi:DegT/DnrJ/EryC1/StrS family aminotransferase [Baekduia sp. Peel2402]|uniref:DegT/DnrJ/EryC1/StrS family aminotransferase n=1 Tax=Baekduia sp. Peel2402 TaxID=3458296 RepID=UPI00403E6724